MGVLLSYSISYSPIVCCYENCGTIFAVPESFKKNLMDSGSTFYCPNGHEQRYNGDSTEEKLRKELEYEKQRHLWTKNDLEKTRKRATKEERKARAYKGHFRKYKTRVENGSCPHCKRHFSNLRRHIESKHSKCSGRANSRKSNCNV